MNRLTGIHAVREALEANQPLDSLLVARGSHGNRIEELVRLARQHVVPVRFEERIQLDRSAETRSIRGVIAFVAASPSASFEDLLKPRDSECSPRPVGSSRRCRGPSESRRHRANVTRGRRTGRGHPGTPRRRLTDSVARASAGALAHLPVARVKNLSSRDGGNERGRLLACRPRRHAEKLHTEVDFKIPVGIVLGGEGKGLHALVRERCDFLVSIPTTGPVRALNVSVAAGVVLFEAVRQRGSDESENR